MNQQNCESSCGGKWCGSTWLPSCGLAVHTTASDVVSNQGKFAVWHEALNVLLYVDAPAFTPAWQGSVIRAFQPSTQTHHEVLRFDKAIVGSVMPRRSGGMVFAVSERTSSGFSSSFRAADIDSSTYLAKNVSTLAQLPSGTPGQFNNGNCDPSGRYLVGTYLPNGPSMGAVMGAVWSLRRDTNGEYHVQKAIEGVQHPNGLVWEPDGKTLLFSETHDNKVYRYPYSADGSIGVRQTWVAAEDGEFFDSMCGMMDGSVFISDPRKGRLLKVSPNGDRLCAVDVPGVSEFVAACAFGRNGGGLYIPTGRNGGNDHGPAGLLFYSNASDVGVGTGITPTLCDV